MKNHWKDGRVIDLIERLESGASVNGADRVPTDDEPAVLKVSAVTYGVFDQYASKPILDGEILNAKCNPQKGQILISRSNTPDLVGASVIVDRDYPNRYLSDKLWQTVPKKNVKTNLRWLAHLLASPRVRFRLSSLATGTSNSMKNITKEELLSLPISIPPLNEQTAIADLLSTWDTAIEKIERLIAAKETRFSWLRDRLINQEIKKGKWQQVKLMEVFSERVEPKFNDLPLLSITREEGVILREDVNRKDTSNNDKSKYLRICPGDIGYNTMRMWQGVSALSTLEGIVSPAYTICIPSDRLYGEFVALYFKTPLLIHKFYRFSQGLTSDTWNLKFKHFKEIKASFPPLKQQKQIAATLKTARSEIDLLKKQLKAYRKQKRGLMQKLLTGQWRVKIIDKAKNNGAVGQLGKKD